jgi:hypothetical protein
MGVIASAVMAYPSRNFFPKKSFLFHWRQVIGFWQPVPGQQTAGLICPSVGPKRKNDNGISKTRRRAQDHPNIFSAWPLRR